MGGSIVDPLPDKEVVRSVHRGNRKAAFCSGFVSSKQAL